MHATRLYARSRQFFSFSVCSRSRGPRTHVTIHVGWQAVRGGAGGGRRQRDALRWERSRIAHEELASSGRIEEICPSPFPRCSISFAQHLSFRISADSPVVTVTVTGRKRRNDLQTARRCHMQTHARVPYPSVRPSVLLLLSSCERRCSHLQVRETRWYVVKRPTGDFLLADAFPIRSHLDSIAM